MRTTFFSLAGLGLLAGNIGAAPVTTRATNNMRTYRAPFEVTGTCVKQVQGGNTTIHFTVHDPSPLANNKTTCTATWVTGSHAFPTGPYLPCGNSSFAWNFDSFTKPSQFVLNLEHVYEDDAIGEYPYNEISTFAHASVAKPNITCTAVSGRQVCEQKSNVVIKAPIWAVSS